MRLRVVLLAGAVAVTGLLGTAASADPCVRRSVRLFGAYVNACVAENGCVVFQESGSDLHRQHDVCALPYPAESRLT